MSHCADNTPWLRTADLLWFIFRDVGFSLDKARPKKLDKQGGNVDRLATTGGYIIGDLFLRMVRLNQLKINPVFEYFHTVGKTKTERYVNHVLQEPRLVFNWFALNTSSNGRQVF